MDTQRIIKQFEEGKSLRQLEKETGINRKKLSTVVKQAGIEVAPAVITAKKEEPSIKIFSSLQNEVDAYWFGFMSADASLLTGSRWVLDILQAEKDREHVEKLRDYIAPGKDVKTKIVKLDGKEYSNARLTIYSKDLCKHLLEKGFREKKRNGVTIPKEIIYGGTLNHFLRGYFDGDGSIASNFEGNKYAYIEFFGDEELIDHIQEILHIVVGTSLLPKTLHGKARGARYGGWHNVSNICDYLYRNATVYLPRKYEEYQKVVKGIARLRSNS